MSNTNILRTERMHLFTPNINVVTKINIFGKPDFESIKRAIEVAVDANEILNCSIDLLENGVAKYRKNEKPIYSIKLTNVNWIEIVNKNKEELFSIATGELVRFFVIIEEQDVQLLIIMHHLAGDGLSAAFLIEDIMESLAGNVPKYKTLNIASIDEFPKDSQLNFITKVFVKRLNGKWLKNGKVFSYVDYKKMFTDYWHQHKSLIYCEQLSTDELNVIHKLAKKNGVSINTVFTSVFLQVYGKKADIGLAINVRDKGYRGMGNYASGISTKYTYKNAKGFIQNLKLIHKIIYRKLNNDKKKYFVLRFLDSIEETLLDSVNMVAFGGYKNKTANYVTRLMGYSGRKKSFGISNLGKLNIPTNYGKFRIEELTFIPPIISNNCRVIGIATIGEQVCITMNVIDDGNVEYEKKFFIEAIKKLKSMSEFS